MIKYIGGNKFKLDCSNDTLTRKQLQELHKEIAEHLHKKPEPEKKRRYIKQKKVIELFTKYYTGDTTKAEVYRQIAKELDMTFEAVKKAYSRAKKI